METAGQLSGATAVSAAPAGAPTITCWPALDWRHPWLAPMRGVGHAVDQAVRTGAPLWHALNEAAAAPVRFVPQTDLPPDMAYEQFIAQTGTCPTRDGWHDFFNGMCWIHFPATKRRLNQLQAAQIGAQGIRPVRGAVRDALTVLDENAAFLGAPPLLWDALRHKRWEQVFGALRPLWQDAHLVLFGHALLEKLQAPRKAITAHVLEMPRHLGGVADIDAWVAHHLNPQALSAKPFAHLPVLGVPGWWPANGEPAFYQDATVFRPARQSAPLAQ